MLIAFEGQDGAGKSALLAAVRQALRDLGIGAVAVPEFSDSPYGRRLVEAVVRDKFLRPVPTESATVLTRVFDEVADLYYLDERVIGPALDRQQVVLKDRYLDTLFYTLVPMLVNDGAVQGDEQALAWLRSLLGRLRHEPDVTVYVEAPLPIRLERIARRERNLREDRAHKVSEDDLAVFAMRDQLIQKLQAEPAGGRMVVRNGDRPIEEGAGEVVEVVRGRLA